MVQFFFLLGCGAATTVPALNPFRKTSIEPHFSSAQGENRMKLSIIIINWNTEKLLADCLKSVFNNPPLYSYEVIVVDNASSDNQR